ERGAVVVVRVAAGGAGAVARTARQRLGLAAIADRHSVLVSAPRRPTTGDQPPAPLAAAGCAGGEQLAGFPPGEHHLTRHVRPPIVEVSPRSAVARAPTALSHRPAVGALLFRPSPASPPARSGGGLDPQRR